jgi:SAM-dependent methyltransferase
MTMKRDETMRLYHDLSWLWPIIAPPEDYIEEKEFLIHLIKEYGAEKVKTILNLGSGGGNLDFVLKREFIITGIDISLQMMALAQKLNPEVEYIPEDMRSARLNRKFDAVILHDAVAHMETIEELKAAFLTGYEHLNKGGILITLAEEWSEHFVQNRTIVKNHKKDNLELTYITNNYDPDPSDSTYECTFVYLIRREGFLETQTDRMVLGMFPLNSWNEALREVGFEVVQLKSPRANIADGLADESYPVFVGIKR